MNLIININDYQTSNVSFSDFKKNMIIDGIFSKILYIDNLTTVEFNGLYLYFNIISHQIYSYNNNNNANNNLFYININNYNNESLIKNLIKIEYEIIEKYKYLYKINKTSVYSLKNQLNSGNVKIYKSAFLFLPNITTSSSSTLSKTFVLKISGVWENKNSIGITYKINGSATTDYF
jgi:hypothetical protein